jgi:hypothetical protein
LIKRKKLNQVSPKKIFDINVPSRDIFLCACYVWKAHFEEKMWKIQKMKMKKKSYDKPWWSYDTFGVIMTQFAIINVFHCWFIVSCYRENYCEFIRSDWACADLLLGAGVLGLLLGWPLSIGRFSCALRCTDSEIF